MVVGVNGERRCYRVKGVNQRVWWVVVVLSHRGGVVSFFPVLHSFTTQLALFSASVVIILRNHKGFSGDRQEQIVTSGPVNN